MPPKKNYKWCFVPQCKNTSISTPEKLFVSVPNNVLVRKRWLKAARRSPTDIKLNSHIYCCEDHFNMEEDCSNWLRYTLVGGNLIMKKDVVPHKFACQLDKSAHQTNPRVYSVARETRCLISSLLNDEPVANKTPTTAGKDENFMSNEFIMEPNDDVSTRDVAVQTDETNSTNIVLRSKKVQCNLSSVRSSISVAHVACSPFQNWKVEELKYGEVEKATRVLDFNAADSSTSISDLTSSSDSDSSFESNSNFESSDDTNEKNEVNDELNQSRARQLIRQHPRLYLGLSNSSSFSIIGLLSYKIVMNPNYQKSGLRSEDLICLVIRKLRLNEPFKLLGIEFGISGQHASSIFCSYLSYVADNLKELIYWPIEDSIKRMLPISFRKNYSKVQSIIDCFEIEIEKPSDPVNQSLTWSQYKSCNTLKYLISITPDGLINFVSTGYGGRISDEMIVSVSGYLDLLRPGMHVMADRGFKKIETLVRSRGCVLVRPASVSSGVKSCKKDVLESRKIAGLRIHVERAIRRLREYNFISPHSCISNKLLRHTDDAVKIVCGLVNLQSPLIKQV